MVSDISSFPERLSRHGSLNTISAAHAPAAGHHLLSIILTATMASAGMQAHFPTVVRRSPRSISFSVPALKGKGGAVGSMTNT